MKRFVLLLATFAIQPGLRAEDPVASNSVVIPELEISADETPAPAATPDANSPKLEQKIDLSATPKTENFEIEPPKDSPNPESTGELIGPLPGDQEVPASIPVSGTVEVSAKNHGKIVRASTGNLVRISLESNPSTGYNWELRDFEDGVAIYHGSELVARQGGNVLFGAPGDTVITLQAVKPGTQDIKLVYRRPWEPPEQVAAAFAFRLEVTGPEKSPAPSSAP
ncbi:MAG: hypothetical protein FGM15_05115 [Chthoniobacterales bacterium]|nr:hypothetical protein [Chthoniobacterales bacterium]